MTLSNQEKRKAQQCYDITPGRPPRKQHLEEHQEDKNATLKNMYVVKVQIYDIEINIFYEDLKEHKDNTWKTTKRRKQLKNI